MSILAHQCASRSRVLLMSGHRRYPVVKYVDHYRGFVDDSIDQTRYSRMEEGRVSDDREDLLFSAGFFYRLAEPHTAGNAGSHTDDRVGNTQRRHYSKRIAADVSCYNNIFIFSDLIEKSPVGTSGAKNRRTRGNFCVNGIASLIFAAGKESSSYYFRSQFVHPWELFSAGTLYSHDLNEVFDVGLVFLYHINSIDHTCKFPYKFFGQRPCKTKLQI